MATLHSIGSGNWTGATTWGVVDATSFSDSIAATSFATGGTSQSFTPGPITISGISLFLRGVAASPSGTFNVALFAGASLVTGASVTINVADLPSTGGDLAGFIGNGWTYFKFASNVTLLAATSYNIRATAGANQVGVFRNATANNWSRALVTTTNQAPVNGDVLIIAGQYTAASASSSNTVVMDNTVGATFGVLWIHNKGTLTWGTASATNYVLGTTAFGSIARAGAMYMGSSASRIPDNSTATFNFAPAAVNVGGITTEGIFHMYGSTVTHTAKLVTNEAAGATTSSVNVSTGWKTGDRIVFPSTAYSVPGQTEVVTLTANASDTTVFHTALVNAHGGSASTYVQADLGNLTRNVRCVGASATLAPLTHSRGISSNYVISYGELRNFGGSTTVQGAISYGNTVASQTSNSTLYLEGASIWMDNLIAGRYGIITPIDPSAIGASVSVTIKNNIVLNYGIGCINIPSITYFNSPLEISGNLFYRTSTTYAVTLGRFYDFNNNVVAAAGNSGGLIVTSNFITDSFSGNSFYSNTGVGFSLTLQFGSVTGPGGATYSNNTTFRNTSYGALITSSITPTLVFPSDAIVFDNYRSFGNQFNFTLVGIGGNVRFLNSFIWGGDTTLSGNTSNYGLVQQGGLTNNIIGNSKIDMSGGAFGMMPSGVTSSHAISNIVLLQQARLDDITITGATFTGTDLVTQSRPAIVFGSLGVVALNYDGLTGSHRAFTQAGTISTDTVIFNTASPSMRMAPGIGTSYFKMTSHIQRIPVTSGNTCTVTVFVRKSAVGDGTAYNGSDPRLILRYNALAGNLSDVFGATASGAAGSWQQLSYTTPAVNNTCVLEFYIDCDGTTGWINVADWATTTNINSRGINYWSSQGPYVEISNVAGTTAPGGGSFTFVS